MQARHPTRRFVLLLPLALAACGGDDDDDLAFVPLRYNDLPPIQLKVASIGIEERFVPSGVPPDVSNRDPVPPVEALKAMANDRLQAFGTANKAVFAILDASLTRDNDLVTGSFAVSLTILDDNGTQLGFAEARVQSRHTGRIDDIRPVLYDITRALMSDMNIEFEYQIRQHLKPWLTTGTAPAAPVEQAPLDGSDAPAAPLAPAPVPGDSGAPAAPAFVPNDSGAPAAAAPVPSYTPAYPPTYLQPPQPQPQPQ
jgi:hypothetical protein